MQYFKIRKKTTNNHKMKHSYSIFFFFLVKNGHIIHNTMREPTVWSEIRVCCSNEEPEASMLWLVVMRWPTCNSRVPRVVITSLNIVNIVGSGGQVSDKAALLLITYKITYRNIECNSPSSTFSFTLCLSNTHTSFV